MEELSSRPSQAFPLVRDVWPIRWFCRPLPPWRPCQEVGPAGGFGWAVPSSPAMRVGVKVEMGVRIPCWDSVLASTVVAVMWVLMTGLDNLYLDQRLYIQCYRDRSIR